jgi:hypothetical protein
MEYISLYAKFNQQFRPTLYDNKQLNGGEELAHGRIQSLFLWDCFGLLVN